MKLGIIRCMQTEDYCPGSRDFRTIRERRVLLTVRMTSRLWLYQRGGCLEKGSAAGPLSGESGGGHHRLCLLYQ